MNEWIARVMPLPVREEWRATEPPIRELARFRIRIVSPHARPGPRSIGERWNRIDMGPVHVLALDSANPSGGVGGSLDSSQVGWLLRELERSRDRFVVVASHDSSLTMTSDRSPAGQPPRILGAEFASILLAHEQVIAWVSGTMHHRAGRRHGEASHGFWELPAASEGRDAPLAGGLSVAIREDRKAVIMSGALSPGSTRAWELPDRGRDRLLSARST
jgi:hypothetical protein